MKNLELFVLILFKENQKKFNILKFVKKKKIELCIFLKQSASKKVPDIILMLCCCIEKNSSITSDVIWDC